MLCGLGEEERTKIRKKKKGKKRNKPYRGEKWVVWDERVSWDIQPYEIFFAVQAVFDWNRFLRQTCGAVFGF